MINPSPVAPPVSRRRWLQEAGCGFGSVALSTLLAGERSTFAVGSASSAAPGGPLPPHFTPRAKRVIFLFMHGGPSHVDLFDPKPELKKLAGEPLPDSFGMV